MSKLIVGNWKMNGLAASLDQVKTIVEESRRLSNDAKMVICPPFTLLDKVSVVAKNSNVSVGAQDCHPNSSGAHTGDISVEMLHELDVAYVIVGHSERREAYRESNVSVASKAEAVLKLGLTPIICVGEKIDIREAGKTLEFIANQLSESIPTDVDIASVVIAYEPVWAIGTGKSATPEQISEVHRFIVSELCQRFSCDDAAVRILYGGSISPANANEIFAIQEVSGGLIGGASLKAESFLAICKSAN